MFPFIDTLESEQPAESFARDFTLSDHAELCDWIDSTEASRAAAELDAEAERASIESSRFESVAA